MPPIAGPVGPPRDEGQVVDFRPEFDPDNRRLSVDSDTDSCEPEAGLAQLVEHLICNLILRRSRRLTI